jgi:hypothetical protein
MRQKQTTYATGEDDHTLEQLLSVTDHCMATKAPQALRLVLHCPATHRKGMDS